MGKFKSLLTGGILGLIAGVLIAPKKGEETREKLKEESSKLSEKIKDTTEKTNKIVNDIVEKTKGFFSKN